MQGTESVLFKNIYNYSMKILFHLRDTFIAVHIAQTWMPQISFKSTKHSYLCHEVASS